MAIFPINRYVKNRNNMTEFILLGLTLNPKMQKVIFVVFMGFYIVSVVRNVVTMVTTTTSPLLGPSMYFFLAHLSFTDVCYSCVNIPKLNVDSLHKKKASSFIECMCQIFGEHLFAGADVILLTAMAYDHYMAICKPLHYKTIMNWQVCWLLVGVAWAGGFLHAIIQILFIFRLHFCGPNIIDHFMCDLNTLLNLACTDTHTLGLFVAANSGFICLLIVLLLVGSYTIILFSLRTWSLEPRQKALSILISHITMILLFFVPSIFTYMKPAVTLPIDKAVAVFYTMITPMLNPLIHTLRSDQMKNAIRKLCGRKVISSDQ
ncbi:TPA: olfactory receptor 1264-like [Bos taurus]|nr:TPA: olfactory receptor 1264-like [Bos taurus]